MAPTVGGRGRTAGAHGVAMARNRRSAVLEDDRQRRMDGDRGSSLNNTAGPPNQRQTTKVAPRSSTAAVIDLCVSSGDEEEDAMATISASTARATRPPRHDSISSESTNDVVVLLGDEADVETCDRTLLRNDQKKRSCREITASPSSLYSSSLSKWSATASRKVEYSNNNNASNLAAEAASHFLKRGVSRDVFARSAAPPRILLGTNFNSSASSSSYTLPLPLKDTGKITYDILPLVKEWLASSHPPQDSKQGHPQSFVRLHTSCSSTNSLSMTTSRTLQHIQQSDKWSCGFRNLQMLLTALVPLLPQYHLYFQQLHHVYNAQPLLELLDHDRDHRESLLLIPSLTQLQEQLEESWRQGFDQKGARHFKYSIVGQRSRIGACEVSFACSFWHLDSCVAQFLKSPASRRCLPAFCFAYFCVVPREVEALPIAEACLAWAEQQFASPQPPRKLAKTTPSSPQDAMTAAEILPLYLQWEGHSVTVIGVEPPPVGSLSSSSWNWNQLNLLILDPLLSGDKLKHTLAGSQPSIAPLRLPCRKLANKDCQLVVVSSGEISHAQREGRKENVPAVTAAKDAVMRLGD